MFADETGTTKTTEDAVTIAATGHQLTNHPRVEKTCTTDGTKEYWTCNTCHKVFSDAACTQETTVEKMKIPQGHEIGNEPTSTTPATCEDNEKKYYKCKNCDENVCIEQSGTKLGHQYEKNDSSEEVWTVIEEPTDTTEGKKQRTCTRCKKTETEPIFLKNSSAEGGQ